MEKNKITLVPKIGTIFYDETIDNTVILSNITNESDCPPILTFCTLQNSNSIERFCYSFDMSSENESRLRRLYVNGFNKSLIPQEVTRDNVKVNDPLIGDWGLVFVMGLLTTVAVCVDTRGFIRLCRLGNNQLFKRDDIIPSNYLKNVLYRASFMYRRKSKLINISTEKAYELYSSDKYDNDTQGIKELAFTSLRNACKIQLKRNLVFGKKLDLSSLEFINCVNNNIELVNHHGAQ